MTYCCDALKVQLLHTCAEHPDPSDCPDALIVQSRDGAEFGIRVHDGGSSFVRIDHCPWCGAHLPPSVDESVPQEPADDVSLGRHVFLLWHIRRHDNGSEDEKLIGVYSSERRASAAQVRVADQPGFRDHPDGFEIAQCRLDRDGWIEGFGEAS
jgi:hypothetical protein